jgi:hypothetical protein
LASGAGSAALAHHPCSRRRTARRNSNKSLVNSSMRPYVPDSPLSLVPGASGQVRRYFCERSRKKTPFKRLRPPGRFPVSLRQPSARSGASSHRPSRPHKTAPRDMTTRMDPRCEHRGRDRLKRPSEPPNTARAWTLAPRRY